MNEVNESKLDTIKGLLAKAESTEFEAEADQLREKAFALMAKYGVEQAMLADAGTVKPEATRKMFVITGAYHNRRVLLLHALNRGMRCRDIMIQSDKRRRGEKTKETVMWVYGMPSDVERVSLMFESLDLQLASDMSKSMDRKPADVHGRTWCVNFITSFADRILTRVRAAEEQAKVDEETYGGERFALVLHSNASLVNNYFDSEHSGIRKANYNGTASSAGWAAGAEAGNRAKLGGDASVGGGRTALSR